MKVKFNVKEKISIACIIGAAAMIVAIPMCCCHKRRPEKRFLEGGKVMMDAIPGIAKKYSTKIAKKILP